MENKHWQELRLSMSCLALSFRVLAGNASSGFQSDEPRKEFLHNSVAGLTSSVSHIILSLLEDLAFVCIYTICALWNLIE